MQINIHSYSVPAKMMKIDASTEQMLTKCSRLKIRDYRNHTKNSIDELQHLITTLEARKSVFCHSLQPLVNIIQIIISSIDRKTLWKSKGKIYNQQLAQIACRLFKYLCQLDAERAASEQGVMIIHSVLQWLKDDTDFCLTKSVR